MTAPECFCKKQSPHPYNETVIFRRSDVFYLIDGPSCEDWARHAALNPGTLSIEGLDGSIFWSLQ